LGAGNELIVTLGGNKLKYESSPGANTLNRPVESPKNFDWNSVYGLWMQAKENIRQRHYTIAETDLKACLAKDSNYLPALGDYALVLYRNMQYAAALEMARRALSVDTYDPAANYHYGLINNKLGNTTDAKDGFDIAAMGIEYRSAAYIELAKIYFKEGDFDKAIGYSRKCLEFNRYDMDAWQLLAVIDRLKQQRQHAAALLDTILQYDALNHFARFEKYQSDNSL
jgi:tetratricopeptide (TPR) repeat protein